MDYAWRVKKYYLRIFFRMNPDDLMARSLSFMCSDGKFGAKDLIHQRRFTGVGFANDCYISGFMWNWFTHLYPLLFPLLGRGRLVV
jgi:hypothetical protein